MSPAGLAAQIMLVEDDATLAGAGASVRPLSSMHPAPNDVATSLYAELLEHSPHASAAEVEALCARHPELAAELRGLHATRGLLEDVGRDVASSPPHEKSSGQAPELEGFQILRQVGRGGMAEVWEAFDLTLGRRVALKLIAPFAARSPRESERFRREAMAAARLGHPNVVALFSTGEHAGRPYLVQELIEGGRTLRDEIEEVRRIGAVPDGYEQSVAERFAAVADALALAHSEGVVHRDVKPQNILLEPDGTPKLADFGLAKTIGDASLSLTGEFVGTWLYASPEQVSSSGAEVGPSSDVFGLGATLYECLTLERPFGGDDLQAIARKILHEDPIDPRALRPRIERDLAVICLHALEKRPAARYASMEALRDDLRRYLAGEAILARPPSLARRLQRAVLRRPTASMAILLSAAAFVVILYFLGRTDRARGDLAIANDRLVASNTALEAAREQAQTEADTSAEVVGFLKGLFRAGDPNAYGINSPTLRELILNGAEKLRSGEVSDPHVRARLLDELGVLLSRLGHWDEATSMLTEAWALWQELGLQDTSHAVDTRVALGSAHLDQGRSEECRTLLEPLLERVRAPSDLDDATRLTILGSMGFVWTELGDPGTGEVLLREAMELVPKLGIQDRPLVHAVRIPLAANLLRQGRSAEAAGLIETLCVELEPLLSAGNPHALDAFNLRGKLRLDQGRFEESVSDFELALESAERNLGADHPRCANLLTSLSSSFLNMGRWEEAEELVRYTIDLSTENFGADSTETLSAVQNLGAILMSTRRLDEAEELLRSAVDQEIALSGENNRRTAAARTNLATCLYRLGRPAEAAEMQSQALESVSEHIAERANMEAALALYRSLSEKL